MKKWDYDCSLMCRIQGSIFEKSISSCKSSSSVFVKRYMNSYPAYSMDNGNFLNTTLSDDQALELLNKKYPDKIGNEKYTLDEMFWIGYVYRAWAYVYEAKSKDIVKICTPKEMKCLYLPYHTLDPLAAIKRILEARDIKNDIDLFEKTENLVNLQLNKKVINNHF